MVCPECEAPYDLRGNEENCAITCPMPVLPNHGQVVNGECSWIEDVDLCRANMRTIAGQAVIYFAGHNCYPNSLEEIGMSGVVCPTCLEEYELIGTETEFYVSCPMPIQNHGFIDDGVASWFE